MDLADSRLWFPAFRLFSASRGLAIAGWMAGLEPVRPAYWCLLAVA